MIFDFLTPLKGKMFCHCTPIHVSNSHIKFGSISFIGLGGDSITDGPTEAITIPLCFFLKKRWDNYRKLRDVIHAMQNPHIIITKITVRLNQDMQSICVR